MIENSVLAPCGIDCRLCSAYQRSRAPCPGCGGSNDNKPYHCQKCSIVLCENRQTAGGGFCSGCAKFPCRRLKQLDKRYREKYHYSMLESLDFIKENGEAAFLALNDTRWPCRACGGLVCLHRDECLHCGAPVDWEMR